MFKALVEFFLELLFEAIWDSLTENLPLFLALGIGIPISILIGRLYLLRYSRFKRYAESYPKFAKAFEKIRIVNHLQFKNEISDPSEPMKDFCDCIQDAFEHITCKACYVSIKAIDENNYISTLHRDRKSEEYKKQYILDDLSQIHHLKDNSFFTDIINSVREGKRGFFFSNFLPLNWRYKNSRIKEFLNNEDKYPVTFSYKLKDYLWIINLWIRLFRYPLKYKSSIVVPIYLRINEAKYHQKIKKDPVAYLCIDSPKNLAFDSDFDTPILEGVAEGIFYPVAHFI